MSVFKANSKYTRDERGLAVPSAANGTFRSAQQRKKAASPSVVSFDESKRNKFLTGFGKRRQARRKQGYLQKLETERDSKLELRREQRRELVDLILQDRKRVFSDALVAPDLAPATAADSAAAAAAASSSSSSRKRQRVPSAFPGDGDDATVDVLQFGDDDTTATVVVEPLVSLRNPVLELDAHINDAAFCDATCLFRDAKFPTAVLLRLKLDAINGGAGTRVIIEEECMVHPSGQWQVPFLKIAFNWAPDYFAPYVVDQLRLIK